MAIDGKPSLQPGRWARLSPLLDELLDLDEPARADRLRALHAEDGELGAELEVLLQGSEPIARQRFLENPVLPVGTAHQAGRCCGAWKLISPLGEGGMGSVWLAERSDGRYEGQAAVKQPHPSLLADRTRGGLERFAREGRLLARLAHPHIAALLDAGVADDGQPYLVLEVVQGEPITAWCDAHRSGIESRVALLLDVIDAVAHAHQQLVLHRDLKPSNILVDAQGRVKLLDFGIAKLIEAEPAAGHVRDGAATTQLVFTPDHAAPEQLAGEPASTGTDVYALGVLLYQLLSGHHPTAEAAQSPVERLRAVVDKEPLPMSEAAARGAAPLAADGAARRSTTPTRLARQLRGDLDTIAAKALKKNVVERYASAAALADDLRRWQRGEPVLARPDSAGYRITRFVGRHRAAVAASAAALLLLMATAVVAVWQAHQARVERDQARWQAERAFARGNLFNLVLGRMGGLDEPLTQRRVLQAALALIEEHHAADPKHAVELLLPIAGQFHTLGDVKADLAVMQRAAQLAAASGSAELVAMVACATVDTQIALGNPQAAAALVQQGEAAIATIAAGSLPSMPLRTSCWAGKVLSARELGHTAEALAAAETAVNALEAESPGKAPRGNMYPFLLGLLAGLRADSGDMPGALAASERVVQVSLAAGGAGSLDARARQRNLAVFMFEAGEIPAAKALLDQALQAWQGDSAPPHMLLPLARAHLLLGDSAAARAVIETARVSARKLDQQDAGFEIALLSAQLERGEGRPDQARQHLQALAALPPPSAKRTPLRGPGTEWALLLAGEGRTGEALQRIEAELQSLQARGTRRQSRVADTYLAAAQVALAAGQPARAREWAAKSLEAAERGSRNAAASAHAGHARLVLAQALQALGDAAAAAAAADRAAPVLARGLGEQHALHRQALALARASR